MSRATLAALAAASVLAACGGEDEAAGPSYPKEAEALLPKIENFSDTASADDETHPGRLFICDIDSLFWDRVKSRAATPLIRDGEEKYVVLVGAFKSPAAASSVYDSLLGVGSRRCYSDVAEVQFEERTGYRPVTDRRTQVTRSKNGRYEGTAVAAAMQLDLAGGSVPSFSTLGVIRRGRVLYLVLHYGKGQPLARPLPVYERLLRGSEELDS